MNPVARVRHVLARRPWLYWLAVLVLAATAGLVVADAAAGVEAARRSWGATRPVVVAAVDVAPASSSPTTSRSARCPSRWCPPAPCPSCRRRPPPASASPPARWSMAHDVAATTGPRALIPDGWRAVPVAELVPSGAAVGDEVTAASGGVVLADDGVVVGAARRRRAGGRAGRRRRPGRPRRGHRRAHADAGAVRLTASPSRGPRARRRRRRRGRRRTG